MPERFFETLAAKTGAAPRRAPARLKARLYSALVARQAPLRSVSETADLCVFENLVRIAPVGERVKSLNFCRVCHARLLAETFEHPPIWWSNCPYARFGR